MPGRNRTLFSRIGYAIWIALALACGSLLAEEIRWAPDIAVARKASIEYQVPVLLHFYGDDCLPCKVLEQNVLSRPEVIQTLNKYFICVKINASRERQTAAEYGVHSWPTDVFISPDGSKLDQGVCKPNVGDYMGVLHNIAVMNRDRNTMLAADQSQHANQITSQSASYAQPAGIAQQSTIQNGLPPAGVIHPNNPNGGPNFYAQGTSNQQLPGSLAPNSGVSSGPMLSHNQPHSVTTAVQATGNQIAAGSQQYDMNNSGRLPAVERNAQIPPASQANLNPMAALAATAPSVPTQVTIAPQTPNAWNQAYAATPQSQYMANPHFATNLATNQLPQPTSEQAAMTSAAPTTGAAVSPQLPTYASTNKTPASTVSFQPRLNPQTTALVDGGGAVSSTAVTTIAAEASSVPPAALDGFCPIALKKNVSWIKGSPEFAVKHRGRVYYFSSQAAKQEFLASPDASSPILSGYDPMLFLNEGKLVEGSTKFGLLEQVSGSILLFTSAETKQAYEQDFDRNTKALNILLQNAGVK